MVLSKEIEERGLLSFEISKLAKDKGFPSKFGLGYSHSGCGPELFRGHPPIFCPTIWALSKWLRDTHNIVVHPVPFVGDDGVTIVSYTCVARGLDLQALTEMMDQDHPTFEESYASGLLICLTQIQSV